LFFHEKKTNFASSWICCLIHSIELIKNNRYQFWQMPYVKASTEIEKVFSSVAKSCLSGTSQRSPLIVGGSGSGED